MSIIDKIIGVIGISGEQYLGVNSEGLHIFYPYKNFIGFKAYKGYTTKYESIGSYNGVKFGLREIRVKV